MGSFTKGFFGLGIVILLLAYLAGGAYLFHDFDSQIKRLEQEQTVYNARQVELLQKIQSIEERKSAIEMQLALKEEIERQVELAKQGNEDDDGLEEMIAELSALDEEYQQSAGALNAQLAAQGKAKVSTTTTKKSASTTATTTTQNTNTQTTPTTTQPSQSTTTPDTTTTTTPPPAPPPPPPPPPPPTTSAS